MIDYNSVSNSFIRAARELAEKKHAWQLHIQLLASSLFGILIALHNSSSLSHPVARVVFALAIFLLALGILIHAVAIYGHVDAVKRTRKALLDEIQIAKEEHREIRAVSVPSRKIFGICEVAAYTLFVISLLLLASYVVLLV